MLTQIALSAQINLTGTFNDWNTTNAEYRLTQSGEQTYELTHFFRAGSYKFKFTFDGGWARHLGEGTNGELIQPGKEISLKISRHGNYRITLNLGEHRWRIDDAPVTVPIPVINVRGPVELNVPIILDGSESVVPEQ